MTGETPVQAKVAFRDALARGETEPDSVPRGYGYDILCGSTVANPKRFTGYAAFPVWDGWRFPGGISHAAGRYQFEPVTWHEQQAKLNLPDFSPASQDIAAWDLANTVYHRISGGHSLLTDLMLGGQFFPKIAAGLRTTWTSLNPLTFGPRYTAALLAPPTPAPAPAPGPAPAVGTLDTQLRAFIAAATVLQLGLRDLGLYADKIDGDWRAASQQALVDYYAQQQRQAP